MHGISKTNKTIESNGIYWFIKKYSTTDLSHGIQWSNKKRLECQMNRSHLIINLFLFFLFDDKFCVA